MPESNHVRAARHHLEAARRQLHQEALAQPGPVRAGVEKAARHADDALLELTAHGVDVRPGVPEDFPRQ